MLILGDEGHYHGRFPWVTASLVVVNVIVFVAQAFLGEPFTNGFSLVPEEITTGQDLVGTKHHHVKIPADRIDRQGRHQRGPVVDIQIPIKHYTGPFPVFLTLFTSMFMHGNVFHLLGNMWFLLIFGRNVECAMNHGRFLAFYTACGICAGLAHVLSDAHSIIPCLGASGAISGVMGAYVSIHPLNKIKVWFGWYLGVFEIPALIVIGGWFILQYTYAFLSLESEIRLGGVAYWNHIGGFVSGFVMLRLYVLYLRTQIKNEAPEEERVGVVPDLLADGLPYHDPILPDTRTELKAGSPDPFATFLGHKATSTEITEPRSR